MVGTSCPSCCDEASDAWGRERQGGRGRGVARLGRRRGGRDLGEEQVQLLGAPVELRGVEGLHLGGVRGRGGARARAWG